MYLRHSIRRKNGTTHTYWRLVRSVRRGGKVVQETVAQLGELDAQGRASAKLLAQQIMGRGEQRELFEAGAPAAHSVAVRLDQVYLERALSFGGVWLGWTLWRALQLDQLCAELLPAGREAISWAQMAAVLVIARLTEPASELHIAEDWYRKTALEDLLGLPVERVNDDRLYRALDRLLPHKQTIERHLRQRLGELFALEYDLLLYDVTSTYFEGLAESNILAARGYSRDHRPDCKQVCIALVVTREGMPLGYEVFAGNRSDVTTVEEIVATMEARYGLAQRIWVMDRGMTSAREHRLAAADRAPLPDRHARKVSCASGRARSPKPRTGRACAKGWKPSFAWGPMARSASCCVARCNGARKKRRCTRASPSASSRAWPSWVSAWSTRAAVWSAANWSARSGGCLGRNTRAAGRYTVELIDDSARPAGLRLVWSAKAQWDDWAAHSEGCYVLRTNITDWDAELLWRTYIQLSEAEAAFRIHKSELCDSSHLASAHRSGASPYPGVLPRLCAVEDAGAVAKPRRTGQ